MGHVVFPPRRSFDRGIQLRPLDPPEIRTTIKQTHLAPGYLDQAPAMLQGNNPALPARKNLSEVNMAGRALKPQNFRHFLVSFGLAQFGPFLFHPIENIHSINLSAKANLCQVVFLKHFANGKKKADVPTGLWQPHLKEAAPDPDPFCLTT